MNWPISGDNLLALLGMPVEEPAVKACLAFVARDMRPELDPDDPDDYIDWITLNDIGLELGFEDEAYLCAWEESMRRTGRSLLTQLYFHADTSQTQAFPYQLPFGLTFADDRRQVRAKLNGFDDARRSYIHDAWKLPAFDLTVIYAANGLLESISCRLRCSPWPASSADEADALLPGPEHFVRLFGLRWSSARLRLGLAMFGFDSRVAEVRSEHVADLRLTHGLELYFAPSGMLSKTNQRLPQSPAFAAVQYLSEREFDARQWRGALPFGLNFADTQADLRRKIGCAPAEQTDAELCGLAVWHFPTYTLSVLYSNLENHLLRLTLMTPEYWR
jgi:hypothetical protein